MGNGRIENFKAMLRRTGGVAGYDAVRSLAEVAALAVRTTHNGVSGLRSTMAVKGKREGLIRKGASWYLLAPPSLDRDLAYRNFEWVIRALDTDGIGWWWVDGVEATAKVTIAVNHSARGAAVRALHEAAVRDDASASLRIQGPDVESVQLALAADAARSLSGARLVRVARLEYDEKHQRARGLELGCEVEFWRFADDGSVRAPRENRAAAQLDGASAKLTTATRAGREVPIPEVFTHTMLDDVTFPIDVVYTWVDGDDPSWRARKARAAGDDVSTAAFHLESTHAARFRSRDELRYSLRSLDDFAPWVNHIYIVTDRQVPEWLDTSNPRVTVVDHSEIFPDDGTLPVFNSNAIISRLHHIPGLSEHFIYMNDDVVLGRAVAPNQFFLANGIALVSPSRNHRPFGDPSLEVEPHLNITRNIRALLRPSTGRTPARAIKHTPHPMLKSALQELEDTYTEAYERTMRHKFRHHTDIVADQLHHYYAQIIGKAVPGQLEYAYVNVLDVAYESTLADLLHRRHRDAVCLNDAPVPNAEPIEPARVGDFLDRYFPAASAFEKQS